MLGYLANRSTHAAGRASSSGDPSLASPSGTHVHPLTASRALAFSTSATQLRSLGSASGHGDNPSFQVASRTQSVFASSQRPILVGSGHGASIRSPSGDLSRMFASQHQRQPTSQPRPGTHASSPNVCSTPSSRHGGSRHGGNAAAGRNSRDCEVRIQLAGPARPQRQLSLNVGGVANMPQTHASGALPTSPVAGTTPDVLSASHETSISHASCCQSVE